jgi:cyclase
MNGRTARDAWPAANGFCILDRDKALRAQLITTGLYMISGAGGNSVLRLSADGFILVDGQLPDNYEAILACAKKLSYSEQPIRALILTDHHSDRAGDAVKFLNAGTQIIAQENVKRNLVALNATGGNAALPTTTYDREYKFRLGGVEVQLMHFGNADTNGDTVVYFPNLKVVAVGDLFASIPDPDLSAGGSLAGWGPTLAKILKLDFVVAVPRTGPAVRRVDLEALKTKIDILVSRASEAVSGGSKDQSLFQTK